MTYKIKINNEEFEFHQCTKYSNAFDVFVKNRWFTLQLDKLSLLLFEGYNTVTFDDLGGHFLKITKTENDRYFINFMINLRGLREHHKVSVTWDSLHLLYILLKYLYKNTLK